MGLFGRAPVIDRDARNHAAGVVGSLLDGSLPWAQVRAQLGSYHGADRGVTAIYAELRSAADDAAQGLLDPAHENAVELVGVLRRTERFLRSDYPYRWDERGPVEIVGAYLGVCALAWFIVAGAGALLGFGHEIVIAGALLALLLMYVMVLGMAIALIRRLWWRLSAQREGADRAAWPFFTRAECGEALPRRGSDGGRPW